MSQDVTSVEPPASCVFDQPVFALVLQVLRSTRTDTNGQRACGIIYLFTSIIIALLKDDKVLNVCRDEDPTGAGDLVKGIVAERAERHSIVYLVDGGNVKAPLSLELLEELPRISCPLYLWGRSLPHHALSPADDMADVLLGRITMPALEAAIVTLDLVLDAWCKSA